MRREDGHAILSSACFQLGITGAQITRSFSLLIQHTGLTHKQVGLLAVVDTGMASSQREIATHLGVAPSLVVSLVDQLVNIGAVRRTGLVHFSVLPQGNAFMVALMDDTGAFLGEDAGRKPIITNFSSGHSQVNKYRGDREVSHDILQTYGHVLGSSNVGENFPHLVDGFVDLSIEKTDQEGVYHLVYYVTTTDPEGTSKLERIGDCYATLELMR